MLTITHQPTTTAVPRRKKGNNRPEIHRHADEYLRNLEKKAESKITPKVKSGFLIITKIAENFAVGLETMFKSIRVR